MKISIVGGSPIYVSKERGEAIKQQLMIGAEMFEIDGNLIKASAVMAITNESSPSQWGHDTDIKRIAAPVHERATVESDGFKKFKEARARILGKQ